MCLNPIDSVRQRYKIKGVFFKSRHFTKLKKIQCKRLKVRSRAPGRMGLSSSVLMDICSLPAVPAVKKRES